MTVKSLGFGLDFWAVPEAQRNMVMKVCAMFKFMLRISSSFLRPRENNPAPCAMVCSLLTPRIYHQDIWAASLIYVFARLLVRCSVILFFIRIFHKVNASRTMMALLVFHVCFHLSLLLSRVLTCRPVSYAWTAWSGETEGSCIDERQYLWATALTATMWDFFLILVPMPYALRLRYSTTRIFGMIGLGSVWVSLERHANSARS